MNTFNSGQNSTANLSQAKTAGMRYRMKLLIKGFLISLPLLIISLAFIFLIKLVFASLEPMSDLIAVIIAKQHWSINLISVSILILILYLVGLTSQNKKTRVYMRSMEDRYLSYIPLYISVRDLVHQFSGLKKMPFSQAVLVDPFSCGTFMTGFVTEEINESYYTVFVPTAPNPTNGNVYHVHRERIIFLNARTEDVLRTIVGMGTGSTLLVLENEKLIQEARQKSRPPAYKVEDTEKKTTI